MIVRDIGFPNCFRCCISLAAILAQGDKEVLDAEIDARLRARFDLLLD